MTSRSSPAETRAGSSRVALLAAIASGRIRLGGASSWAALSAWLTWLATMALEVALGAWPWMNRVQRRPAPVKVLEPNS